MLSEWKAKAENPRPFHHLELDDDKNGGEGKEGPVK